MKNITLIITRGILVLGGLALLLCLAQFYLVKTASSPSVAPETPMALTPKTDPMDLTYTVDGESIPLTQGKFERTAAPGSATKELFAAFGEPVMGDIDGDGDQDAAMYITRDGGGSGTFYYVVVAVNTGDTYKGTNALFLGDRIAPQNIDFMSGTAVANYAERKEGEAATAMPSVGVSMWISLDGRANTITGTTDGNTPR